MPRLIIRMIEFVRCSDKDTDLLALLWQKVFGDEKKVTDSFFSVFGTKYSYAVKYNKKIVSELHMIPCSMQNIGIEGIKGKYLYAAATDVAYRGKGFMSGLIRYASECEKAEGTDFICLYPAEESLYNYYYKLGFNINCYCAVFDGAVSSDSSVINKEMTAEEFKQNKYRDYEGPFIDLCSDAYRYYYSAEGFGNFFYDETADGRRKLPVPAAKKEKTEINFSVEKDGMLMALTEKADINDAVYLGFAMD